MRGQRLFVRPIESADGEAIQRFLEPHGGGPIPSSGLLGKLVGDLVAVLSMELIDNTVMLRALIVADGLRRKRIGRFMIDELAALCRKMDVDRIIVSEPRGCDEFLSRVGFIDDSGVWVRRVALESDREKGVARK